jgi:hypothetical protein
LSALQPGANVSKRFFIFVTDGQTVKALANLSSLG